MSQPKSEAQLEQTIAWLNGLQPMHTPQNDKQPFVRSEFLNDKKDGCYICGKKTTITKHHIKRGHKPVVVFVCWKHHQILHGTALEKFKTVDLRMVFAIADEYNIWKEDESGMVKKKILSEIERREQEIKNNGYPHKPITETIYDDSNI